MINQTLSQLEDRLRTLANLPEEKRAELTALFGTLKDEVSQLARTRAGEAESIAQFARLSAHEATRTPPSSELRRLASEGLSASVKGFEASHPRLVEIVNAICVNLSNLGI